MTDLADSPRWRALAAFVAAWYERPIEPGDGEREDAVAAAGERVQDRHGARLPDALVELHRLVGRRLRPSGTYVHVPLELHGTDRLEEVWGVPADEGLPIAADYGGPSWVACVSRRALKAGKPDPPVTIEGQRWAPRLSDALLGLVVTETLEALEGGFDAGPLGPLARDVDGGGAPSGADRLTGLEPVLPTWKSLTEGFEERFLGGPDAIVSIVSITRTGSGLDSDSFTWATATRAARARFEAFTPPADRHEVYVRLRGAAATYNDVAARWKAMQAEGHGIEPGGTLGPLRPDDLDLQVVSRDVERSVLALREAFAAWEPEIAGRPLGRARYAPLWPPGRTAWARPNPWRDVDVFAED